MSPRALPACLVLAAVLPATAADAAVRSGTAVSYPDVAASRAFGNVGITPDFLPSSDLQLDASGKPVIRQRATGGSARTGLRKGTVALTGAYEWRKGSTRVRFTKLVLDTRKARIVGTAGGRRIEVLALSGVRRAGGTLRASRAKLTGGGARLLRQTFDAKVFKGGMTLAADVRVTVKFR